MIASLDGTVSALGLESMTLDVRGVGYLVRTSPPTLTAVRLGQRVLVHTELVVREDSMTLYGFLNPEEVDLFRMVQSVNGVGPRIAVAVLAVMAPAQFAQAVTSEDMKALVAIPGIGDKVARRLVLELKDKIRVLSAGTESESLTPAVSGQEPHSGPSDVNRHAADVAQALVGLGWALKPAESAISAVVAAHEDAAPGSASQLDAASLLRLALRELGGRQ